MPDPLKILLTPVGSSGDVHPFVGLGVALRRRGHRVIVITNGHFAPLVRAAGLEFVELGTEEQYFQAISHPDLWSATRGFNAVAEMVNRLVRPMFDLLAEHHEPGHTITVGGSLALGARLAQEKLGLPMVSVHLQPALFRSRVAPAKYADLVVEGFAPDWFRRLIIWLGDVALVDPILGRPLNASRAELGLPPVRGILRSWVNSPLRVLGLFPDWFCPPQPDWPAQARLVGFPLYDEGGVTAAPPGLEEFLASGEAPIAFTPGSAMRFGQRFFAQAADACARLGRRGVLLTRFPEQIPTHLPPGVRHFDFVPLGMLLPRCAAMVHHGGIGTASQALAAGVPQLIMPLSHDQPDNAERIARLGVGTSMLPRRFKGPAVAQALRGLLESPGVGRACKEIAGRFAGVNALGNACDEIEAAAAQAGVTGRRPGSGA